MKKIKTAFSKNYFLLPLLIVSCVISFYACKKTDQQLPAEALHQDMVDYLAKVYGFNKNTIEATKDEIIAEGDMVFSANDFWKKYTVNLNDNAKHYKYGKVTATSNILINVASGTPTEWVDAAKSAVTAWNSISGGLTFSIKTNVNQSTSGVSVYMAELPGTFWKKPYALAEYPSGGYPGWRIRINTKGFSSTKSEKIGIMVHEIGHCIGLTHTDSGEGTLIGNLGTCSTGTDNASIMKDDGTYSWSGFSECDKKAYDAFY
ncbi:MAG: hypothetical protein IPJ81_16995 [Chitinophagaceae bacterium]|nr:hypothetical protein [Chitinophagaceae bacterium]